MTSDPRLMTRSAQHGVSIVTAIFLIVVLALLGAFVVSVTGLQQSTQQLDVQGTRAYQAARAGIEWGAFQVLDPNNMINQLSCAAPDMPQCPNVGTGGTTDLSGLAGSLAPFTVTVTCTRTVTTEGNRNIWMYQLTANACNHQPPGTRCPAPGTPPPAGYVERELTATLSKCKDSTAAAPRCACG